MKKHNYFIFLSIIILFFSCQQGEQPLSEAQKQAIREELNNLATEIANQFNQMKYDLALSNYSDHAILIRNAEIEKSWTEHKKKVRGFANQIKVNKVNNEEFNIDVLSKDVAICYCNYNYTIIDNADNKMEGRAAQTWVFNKENNKWLIRHIHISEPK